jgi:two-component system, OmpR family, KDP operon response regulator KdpE
MAATSLLNGLFARRTQHSNGMNGEVSSGLAAGVIETGDFLINVAARKASLLGQELDLTTAEFEVLVFLAGHPKSFVTPHTMLATDWTSGQIRQAEFLRALMSLTKKLNSAAGSSQHYIRTEPWIFYRFDSSSTP